MYIVHTVYTFTTFKVSNITNYFHHIAFCKNNSSLQLIKKGAFVCWVTEVSPANIFTYISLRKKNRRGLEPGFVCFLGVSRTLKDSRLYLANRRMRNNTKPEKFDWQIRVHALILLARLAAWIYHDIQKPEWGEKKEWERKYSPPFLRAASQLSDWAGNEAGS